MKGLTISMLISLLLTLLTGCDGDKGTEFKLYYLGGQSNMEGYGYVSELDESLKGPYGDVFIFHGNTSPDGNPVDGRGIWAPLVAGHGAGFSSDGMVNRYSDRFGLEMTFAAQMMELDPGSRIAIIKYARGGSSIDEAAAGNFGSWDPDWENGEGINQYDHFLAAVKNAMEAGDIDGDGRKDSLVPSGILWMQGESDGNVSEEIAQRYYDNLVELMSLIRAAFGTAEMPVAIGRISDSGNDPTGIVWNWGGIIREAQQNFASTDPNAGIVTSTDNYGYSDPWHYDSDGYIDLGRQFAFVIDSLGR